MKRIIVFALCLSSISCTHSEVVATLEAAVDAAITEDSIVRPQDIPALAVVTNTCLDPAETILAGTLASPALKVIEIGQACVQAAAILNGNVYMVAVTLALNSFLQAVQAAGALTANVRSVTIRKPDANRLAKIRIKIDKLEANLRK